MTNPDTNKSTTAQKLERTTESLLEAMKSYFIEKDLWDFKNNKPKETK